MEKPKNMEMTLKENPDYKEGKNKERVSQVRINSNLRKGPFLIDDCDTIPKLFLKRCIELGSKKTAHREKHFGKWDSYSWGYYHEKVFEISGGLHKLGFKKSDRLVVLSECRKEWLYIDIACQCLRGICTGVYTTDSELQLEYQLRDSAASFLFLDDAEQLNKFLSIDRALPDLRKVIVLDRKNLRGFAHKKVMFLDELYELGRKFLEHDRHTIIRKIEEGTPEDIALLVYTSGTTGLPKGVMLNQNNLMYAQSAGKHVLPFSSDDELFCFLPLCHIYERTTSVISPIVNKTTVNFVETPDTIFENLQEVSPTYLAGVPRIYEKIFSNVNLMISDATTIGKLAYNRAFQVGKLKSACQREKKWVPFFLLIEWYLWKNLVYRNILNLVGLGRVKRAVSGAAPISEELIEWFHALGLPLVEGYGMSETVAAISVNLLESNYVGTVGKPIPGSSIRISNKGEIEYKAPNVFCGYHNDAKKTQEAFTADGWFKTGDKGELVDGYIKITGRIKDIIITSGGKNISPENLENGLKFSPFISDAIIFGDGKKYLTALIVPDQENLEKFAQQKNIHYLNFTSLCESNEINLLITEIVERVNAKVSRVEQIKDFRVLDLVLNAEDEELTATMKIKRNILEKKHALLIKEMYN